MSIVLHSGKPRQGKTFMMVKEGYERMKKEDDLYCWTNRPLGQTLLWEKDLMKRVHIFDSIEEWNDLVKWMDERGIKKVLILLDEAQGYINSRKWDLLTEEVQYLLQTHGHYGLDFWFTAQHESRIDIVARQLVQNLILWKNIKLFGWVIFYGVELDTDDMDAKEKKKVDLIPNIFIFNPKYDKILYDTHAKIDFPPRKNIVTHKFIRCGECGYEKKIA